MYIYIHIHNHFIVIVTHMLLMHLLFIYFPLDNVYFLCINTSEYH